MAQAWRAGLSWARRRLEAPRAQRSEERARPRRGQEAPRAWLAARGPARQEEPAQPPLSQPAQPQEQPRAPLGLVPPAQQQALRPGPGLARQVGALAPQAWPRARAADRQPQIRTLARPACAAHDPVESCGSKTQRSAT